jgi:phosphoribosylamine--glycine ligase
MMNVLIIGSGGREHALAWKLRQSPLLAKLFIAPGNAGTSFEGENIHLRVSDRQAIRNLVVEKKIDMVVVGPEAPLVEGIHDFFLADPVLSKIPVIGPVARAAMLEGSKDFAKSFMLRHNIPTAQYRSFTRDQAALAREYLRKAKPPYVLKADGLAAGKGVLICPGLEEAFAALDQIFVTNAFGEAGDKLVIEEFLEGIELSAFALCDGKHYKILPEAKDYKRIGEGDTGLNTGGMGSVSPVPFADKVFLRKVEQTVIRPTIEGLIKDGIDYRGFLFFGLMNVAGDPYVIEYNVRMGDPEAESVIPRIRTDLLELFLHVAAGDLDRAEIEFESSAVASVMLVSGGYPGDYEKGKDISGLEDIQGSILFHAGTAINAAGHVITSGGRVMTVTSMGTDIRQALELSYRNAARISFDKMYYRYDLGRDLIDK